MMRIAAMTYFFLLAGCLLLAGGAPGETIYVDCNGGGDYLTIQEGVDAAISGDDRIVIAPGIYSAATNGENFPIWVEGKSRLAIEAEGSKGVTIYSEPDYIFVFKNNDEIEISGLFLVSDWGGIFAFNLNGYGRSMYLHDNTVIAPNYFGMDIWDFYKVRIENNYILQCTLLGVMAGCIGELNLYGNVFYDAGVQIAGSVKRASITNNLLSSCHSFALAIDRGTSFKISWNTIDKCYGGILCEPGDYFNDAVIDHCIITNCFKGIKASRYPPRIDPAVTYSNLWANVYNFLYFNNPPIPGEGGMKFKNPRYSAGPRGRYYLDQDSSPCVDAGNPGLLPPEGTTDPGGSKDIGLPDMGYHYPRREEKKNIERLLKQADAVRVNSGYEYRVNP